MRALRFLVVLVGSVVGVLALWALFLWAFGEWGLFFVVVSGYALPLWLMPLLHVLGAERWLEKE